MSNFAQRILTTLVLGPLFLFLLMSYYQYFIYIMITIYALMAYEGVHIAHHNKLQMFTGFMLLMLSFCSLYFVYNLFPKDCIILYFLSIWTVDSFAYFGGKIFKGPLLFESISPKKTWAGYITGTIALFLFYFMVNTYEILDVANVLVSNQVSIVIAIVFASLEQMSDLLVSLFKRAHHVKDSSHLLPGHGGFLDRFDGLILTSTVYLFYLLF
jgi:phosphatidate cytidylyltransferase